MRIDRIAIVLFLALATYGCWPFDNNDNGTGTSSVDVSGTWHSAMMVETCTPANTCKAAGFTPGQSANATMVLTQNGSNVKGTYTYDGAGINADVSGQVSGNQLTLNGDASNPFGQVTVDLTGTVANSQIAANVSHNISLIDGRSGTVTGSGTFSK